MRASHATTPLPLAAGTDGARLLGIGSYRPSRVVTNDEIAARVDTSDTWIRERTGIVERRVAEPDETVVDMATDAAGKALAAAGVDADTVGLVVVATCSQEDRLPAAAPVVADRLGIPAPGAYDIQAACAGFCYALSNAADAIRSGSVRRALVIGTEKLSSVTDWDDRSTCILWADGAGAVVVGRADDDPADPGRPAQGGNGIGPVVWGSDGSRGQTIRITADDPFLRMDGQAVFRWATTRLAPVARRACEAAGIAPADLDVLVLHQANGRIIDAIARSLRVGPDTVVSKDIVRAGNTSAASIPLALSALTDAGTVEPGATALLLAFGAGLTYAGQVVRLP